MSSRTTQVGGALAATLLAGGALAHAGPALGAIGPLRRGLLPRYAGRGASDHVALTFDDGPQRLSTPRFLDVLAAHRVRATFFVIGRAVAADRPLAREMVAAGHELAVHGWDHRLLLRRRGHNMRDDLRRAFDIVADVRGHPPRWWRPPYGVASGAALHTARELGLQPVLWTAWGRDWTTRCSPASVRRRVMRVAQPGGCVLLHDADTYSAPGSWMSTLGALPGLLHAWQQAGLSVGPLAEHGLTHAGSSPARSASPGRTGGTN
ncbi:polysaccharide deacetylase family protein [Actinomycetospora chiangmaiensis]|uniref:polysaccharide deacetylase family protein n=1 Tax=Actinomycetospora chiangmaiensis TaxID=402650 RepID=UPI00035DC9FA|nr:polysaccharide deacetylase family protein [Actinomycetospora chiangmaiensis]